MRVRASLLSLCLFAAATDVALAAGPYAFVTGRRDPRIYAIDLSAALKAANNNTDKAIISRNLVGPRRLDGVLLGDPANIVLSQDGKTAFVMNHHGQVSNSEFLQHGGRASVSIMDVKKMLEKSSDNTDKAVEKVIDGGWFGGVGVLALGNPDLLITSASEGWMSEDGSNRITFLDPKTGAFVGQIQMAMKDTHQLRTGCPDIEVPWHNNPAPVNVHLAPSKDFGCWPDPESLAIGKGSDGKQYLFAGDAGTEDVAVMDLGRALKGEPVVEIAPRIPVQSGPFGIAASPNGKYIAVTSRETNLEDDNEGNTISIIDVDLARQGKPGAEAARVQVGSDDPKGHTRPFAVAWTPDGKQIVVANFLTNNLSVVDLEKALAKEPGAEVARIPLTRNDGQPARPKGLALTGDGHYAVVAGGANSIKKSATDLTGTAFAVDLQKKAQAATVTGVGIDPYGVAVLDKK
ncbi:MAG TPA: YncE family protein [Xanthobacteraceae bacterium]|nr:YncE family protein [Xanthobacteraceae bacterium]